jgi:CHAD domain-containing protein
LIHVIWLAGGRIGGRGIKRIVSEEIAQAIKEIDNPRLKRSEAIHEVRKHCKKIRSVLRLVRPQFEETYQFENAWFRDTAKGIAELRDAEAIIETYDSLLDKFSDQVDRICRTLKLSRFRRRFYARAWVLRLVLLSSDFRQVVPVVPEVQNAPVVYH